MTARGLTLLGCPFFDIYKSYYYPVQPKNKFYKFLIKPLRPFRQGFLELLVNEEGKRQEK